MAEHTTLSEDHPIYADELLGLSPELVAKVAVALEAEHRFEARIQVEPLRPPECADLLQLLRPELRHRLIEYMRPDFDPEILPELEEDIRDEIAEQLGTTSIAHAIARLESDDALELIETLDEQKRHDILQKIPAQLRNIVEEGLAFPEDSAGRLMERDFVAVPTFWTVGETIDFLREADDLPADFYDIFVVDPRHRAIGMVALSHVLRSKRPVKIADIMEAEIVTVPAMMDQEEVAYLFSQQDLVSAPVVDDAERLIGMVTVDDVLDVIQEEAEEDIMRLGGVSGDDLYSAALETGRSRSSWLFINLLTAIVASIVIGLFQGTIEQIVILAVLMPIVASMGGNAGTQTMTVAVRALATKELTASNALRVLGKEALVGVYNGVLFALLVGCVAWFWADSWKIGGVMAVAMIVTLVLAALSGMAIPLVLARRGIDPAIASSVILTTITDVVAFSAFLGLAAWLLL
ncbi:MAG: magnesium transporter [Rhodospirillaceae bacterium]|nr:magnesium transporter [Rhodospirillaceae bacterium]|tara:strand:- start:8412 stop:9803 length:1392 start_codon:yes stop_codon:yes gene_type:complete